MTTSTDDLDVEHARGGHRGATASREDTALETRRKDVEGVRRNGRTPLSRCIQDAFLQHDPRTIVSFLAGLEHEHHVPNQFAPPTGKEPRRPDEHRGVQVMSASMHSWFLRRKGETGLLLERKGVHIPRSSTDGPGCPPRSTAVTDESREPVEISNGRPFNAANTLA